ncbi:MAG: S24/S26 family peptidase [Methanobacterium sp.]|nr:S24/S26 family peptidase [Methanobacterium sp.]
MITLKLRNIIILTLLALLVVSSAIFTISEQSNNLEITLKTNGTDINVQASSLLFFNRAPESMIAEMQEIALYDLQSDNSTVDSVKNDMKVIAQKYNYNVTVKIDSPFGIDKLPMPATVRGTSMVPTLQDGQSIVVLKTNEFKVGDLVVARHPTYGLIVKRISQIKDGQVYLMSDNRETIVTSSGIMKGLDTWLPIENVVGVVKIY